MNSYLATACLLAAGLDGIEKQLDPGARNDDNLYEMPEDELRARGIDFLPANLNEALDALENDAVIKAALGETYADYYIGVKRDEWRRYHNDVSKWEVENYLGVY